MEERTYQIQRLDPTTTHFRHQGSTLSMTTDDGARFPRVVLRDCFPMSDSTRFLSVRDATTEEQDEIGILDDWEKLAEADRQAAAAELQLFYFVPQVRRIQSIKNEFGFLYFQVDTDKGPLEFVMRDNVISYARQVSETRWILIDVNNARFEIPDVSRLDVKSQRLVAQHLMI